MITKEMNDVYRAACVKGMKNDLATEFEKVIDNADIEAEDKEWAYTMAMNILKQVQKSR